MGKPPASVNAPACRRPTRRSVLLTTGAAVLGARFRSASGAASEASRPVQAVTRGPGYHFFGYYDKCPWDATGKYMLAMEVDFYQHDPIPGEPLTLGLIDLEDQNRFLPFDRTRAWSWQQGTMLQWVGDGPGHEVIYNRVAGDRYVAVIRDVRTGQTRALPRPIYAISRDGTKAVTLDFERVNRLRPGYGYIALPEKRADEKAPEDRGIYIMDLATGRHELVVPLSWAATQSDEPGFRNADHWFNHLQFNPSGTRFLFLHRWRSPGRKGWGTRLYTAAADGSDIRLLSDIGLVSHFDWRDDQTILAWTKTEQKGVHFYLIDDNTGEHTLFADGILTRDGHCSWSPDRQWVLCDTYPDKEGMQTLILYRPADRKRIDVGRFFQPPEIRGKSYRCDLHPRWNRDGTAVCIDSTHEDGRQMYVVDVSSITA